MQHLSDMIKDAMRARDQFRLDTLRYLSAQLQNAQIDKGRDVALTEEEFLKIVQKIIKNSEEGIAQYRQGNREDLVEAEQAKVEIMKEFLPEQLSEAELKAIVERVQAENPGVAMGPLTGLVMKEVAGQADGRQVSAMIRQLGE